MSEMKNNLKPNRKIKKISLADKIHYTPVTEMGKAEFDICPIFERGYLRQIHIIRRQQETNEEFVLDLERELNPSRIKVVKMISNPVKTWLFKISSQSNLLEASPNILRIFWCKEHKTTGFVVRVPDSTDTIEFGYHFGNTIQIRFTKSKNQRSGKINERKFLDLRILTGRKIEEEICRREDYWKNILKEIGMFPDEYDEKLTFHEDMCVSDQTLHLIDNIFKYYDELGFAFRKALYKWKKND